MEQNAATGAARNTPKEFMAYFSVPLKGICTDTPTDGKVSLPEYSAFWKSLAEEDKEYYRTAVLEDAAV